MIRRLQIENIWSLRIILLDFVRILMYDAYMKVHKCELLYKIIGIFGLFYETRFVFFCNQHSKILRSRIPDTLFVVTKTKREAALHVYKTRIRTRKSSNYRSSQNR